MGAALLVLAATAALALVPAALLPGTRRRTGPPRATRTALGRRGSRTAGNRRPVSHITVRRVNYGVRPAVAPLG